MWGGDFSLQPCVPLIVSQPESEDRQGEENETWPCLMLTLDINLFASLRKVPPKSLAVCSKEPLYKSWELFLVRDSRTACSAVCGMEGRSDQQGAEAPLPGDLKRLRDLSEHCLSPHRLARIRLRLRIVPSDKLLWPAPPALEKAEAEIARNSAAATCSLWFHVLLAH